MNRWLPAILIFVILAAFRVIGSLFPESFPNFQPLPAIILCSIVFLKGYSRWLLPLSVWLITDPFTSYVQGYPMFGRVDQFGMLFGLAAIVGIAFWTQRQASAWKVLSASILSAAAFYFLTNCVSFALDPLYVKSWHGFVQAQWTGPDHLGPTWIFLRNLAAGNFLFTACFLAAQRTLPVPLPVSAQAVAR